MLNRMLTEAGRNTQAKTLSHIPVKAKHLGEEVSKIQGRKTVTPYDSDEKYRSAITVHMNEQREFRSKQLCIEERRLEEDGARDKSENERWQRTLENDSRRISME